MSASRHLLKDRPDPGLLSIVLPAYNEEETVPKLRQELTAFLATLTCAVEVIIVNDGSADATLDLLMDWAEADPRIRVLGLARNFGHQLAITAGLDAARGDAVVILDADLQDPPEVIPQMLAKYRQGYDVVYGLRVVREGETPAKRFSAWLFYRLMRTFVYRDLPSDTGDFRLVSRACLDALQSMRETHRFIRGMVTWVGFAQVAVPFERKPRTAGVTKYPLKKLIQFAWTGVVSFSPVPLRMSFLCGLLVGLYGVYAVARKLILRDTVAGWASQVAIICLIGGAILMGLGILGEYVGRIFEEIKGRPLYIVSVRSQEKKRETGGVVRVGVRRAFISGKKQMRRGATEIAETDAENI